MSLRRSMPTRFDWRVITTVVGVAVAVGVAGVYAASGYGRDMPWLLAAAVAAIALGLHRPPAPGDTGPPADLRADVVAVGVLLAVVTPLYWWRIYTIPWQVNTDEVTIMLMARRMLQSPATDVLGVSDYFGFPAASFVFVGRLAEWLGGIGLLHSRLVHASMGIASVLVGYAFFRQLMGPLRAATFAALLGTNHALFAISRMAMRDNSGLLCELLALLCLAIGLRRRSRTALFLAGVSAALGFYGYFPGRIALAVLLATLGGAVLFGGWRRLLRPVAGHAAVVLLGWAVVAAPVVIASRRQPDTAFGYARQQLLIYPEGRKLEMEWTGEKTPAAAWQANIRNGLTTFNAPLHDQGYIYPNRGHAFVDPLTGVLLWIGFGIAAARLARRRAHLLEEGGEAATVLGDLVAITGFLGLYLACALLITKAPNYTRLLVVLPFTSYFAGTALWSIAALLARRSAGTAGGDALRRAIGVGGAAAIAVWNVAIFADFASAGLQRGNDVGSTARYVEARRHAPEYTWILAADEQHRYYGWGAAWQWRDWVGTFAGPEQATRVEPVPTLPSLEQAGNFTILIERHAWESVEAAFAARHPRYEVTWLTPDGRYLAIDVRAAR